MAVPFGRKDPYVDDELQLIKKRELANLLRVNPFTIDNWRKAGRLPEPLTLSPQTVAWRRQDILSWLSDREAEPAETRKPNARFRVVGLAKDATCIQCHRRDGRVFKIKDARKVGSKPETLHEECALQWFETVRARGVSNVRRKK